MQDTNLLPELIALAALGSPSAVALTSAGQSLSYAGLDAKVSGFASGLIGLGLARSKRVAIYLEKRFETVIASFGAPRAGGVFVPVNPLLKPDQVAFILQDCNVRVLVTSSERLATLKEARVQCPDLRHVVVTDGANTGANGQINSQVGGSPDWAQSSWLDFLGGPPPRWTPGDRHRHGRHHFLHIFREVMQRFLNSKCGFHYYHLVAQPSGDQSRLPPTRGKAFAFRLLHTPESVLDSLDRPPAVIHERFAQGAQCLMATRNESLVGCIWFVRDAYAEDEISVDYLMALVSPLQPCERTKRWPSIASGSTCTPTSVVLCRCQMASTTARSVEESGRIRMWCRILGPFKEFGFAAGALYALDRILRSISPHLGLFVYELMVQPITGKPMLTANLAKNLTFVEIGRGHPDVELMPARDDIKQSRFDQGAVCLGVYRKEKLIGYVWFCFHSYEEDEVRCTYELADPAQSVFDFDLYVLPEHRVGIGFVAIWHGANAYLHARGVRYTFSRLTRFNLASRRSHTHLGWKCAANAVFLRIGRVEAMLASVFPYIAVTWAPSQRTRLRLGPDVLGSPAVDTVAAR